MTNFQSVQQGKTSLGLITFLNQIIQRVFLGEENYRVTLMSI